MKFFVDSANIEEIAELKNLGLADGVTTNPSLILKAGRNFQSIAKDICELIEGPVSLEVSSSSIDQMRAEAEKLRVISENVVVKLPMTWNGLKVCRDLANSGIKVNMTLCFTANQAILAAKAGAEFVSPFVGRLDDTKIDGVGLIKEIRTIYDNYSFRTKILAASIRSLEHIKNCAIAGAEAVTAPPAILRELVSHPLTDKGLEIFLSDWEKSNQKI
ncbi:MAG: fructose-6-phosphate aldolase [Rhodobacteraceae bacterium]|nr:MAG: fructose-6-phosphate aldolase [Paracoccaceae bacterium]